jgi:hypothetical protein
MKKVLLVLFALTIVFSLILVASAKEKGNTVNGWVSDSKCAAKGTSASHAACAKKCIAAGEKPVIVSDADQKILTVDNPDAVAGHEGHHVAATGTVTGDSIHVTKLAMLKDQGEKKGDSMGDMHK